jgi:prephenate dehydratase
LTAEWLHQQTANQIDTAEERQLLQQVGLQMEAMYSHVQPAQQQCRLTLLRLLQHTRLPAGKRTTAAAQQCRR